MHLIYHDLMWNNKIKTLIRINILVKDASYWTVNMGIEVYMRENLKGHAFIISIVPYLNA